MRVNLDALVTFLQGAQDNSDAARSRIVPRFGDFLRVLANSARRGIRSPRR